MWFRKKLNSEEYLELKKDLSTLKILILDLDLEFALILKKLKFKYKITKKDLDGGEPKDLKESVLLPDDGTLGHD